MNLFSKLTAAAALAVVGFTAMPSIADAQYSGRGGAYSHDRNHDGRYSGRGGRWNGPEGYFTVRRDLCPDLIEDRRDRRVNRGRYDRREDRRDRQVLNCPARAWGYVASAREVRMGRNGARLRPNVAYLDRRSGQYFVETRWGNIPVQIVGGRGYDRRQRHGYRGNGVSFSFRLN